MILILKALWLLVGTLAVGLLQWLEQRLWRDLLKQKLRIPRDLNEVIECPQVLFQKLLRTAHSAEREEKEEKERRGGAIPRNAELVQIIRHKDLIETEPDKNRTAGSLLVEYKVPGAVKFGRKTADVRGNAGATTADRMGDTDVIDDELDESEKSYYLEIFAKFQTGRGMPWWMQAIRAVAEPGVAREVDFYNKVAHIVPVRSPICYFAGKYPYLNYVCICLERFEVYSDRKTTSSSSFSTTEEGNTDSTSKDEGTNQDNDKGKTKAKDKDSETEVSRVRERALPCVNSGVRKQVRVITDSDGADLSQLKVMLCEVAKLHAKFFGQVDQTMELSWIPARKGLEYAAFVNSLMKKNDEEWTQSIWRALWEYFDKKPTTLAHGDCRPGNMMFTDMDNSKGGNGHQEQLGLEAASSGRRDDQRERMNRVGDGDSDRDGSFSSGVIFGDWEAINVAPLLWDFVYCTTLGQSANQRRASQKELLHDCYLKSLLKSAKEYDMLNRNGESTAGTDKGKGSYGNRIDELRRSYGITSPDSDNASQQQTQWNSSVNDSVDDELIAECDLLAIVLGYIAQTIRHGGFWNNQGNTSDDKVSWMVRILLRVADVDVHQVSQRLNLPTEKLQALVNRCQQDVNEFLSLSEYTSSASAS